MIVETSQVSRHENLKLRTREFALGVISLCAKLEKDEASRIIQRQLLRSATSVGTNYRAACRSQSRADFISKLSRVEEQADECLYWLELLAGTKNDIDPCIKKMAREANELTAIVVASKKTARRNARNP